MVLNTTVFGDTVAVYEAEDKSLTHLSSSSVLGTTPTALSRHLADIRPVFVGTGACVMGTTLIISSHMRIEVQNVQITSNVFCQAALLQKYDQH